MTQPMRKPEDDALCELMSVGVGSALTAMSQLLGRTKLRLGVAETATLATLQRVALGHLARDGRVLAVQVQGAADGVWGLAVDEPTAQRLATRLLHRETSTFDALAQSALCELVNITACAFWNAIARWAPGVYMPGVPTHATGNMLQHVQAAGARWQTPRVVVASFMAEIDEWDATTWLILEQSSCESLVQRVGRV